MIHLKSNASLDTLAMSQANTSSTRGVSFHLRLTLVDDGSGRKVNCLVIAVAKPWLPWQ